MEHTNSSEISPSGKTFLARFVQEQRARGRSSGLHDGLLAHLTDVSATASTQAVPAADLPNPGRLSTFSVRAIQDLTAQRATTHTKPHKANSAKPLFEQFSVLISTRAPTQDWPQGHEEPPAPVAPSFPAPPSPHAPMKTVHDFTAEREAKRAQYAEPPAPLVLFNPVESLTACMNDAECPATARRIFRVLFGLALESVRARGVPVRPDVAVFHLPVELLAAHIERDRATVWRNLKPLLASGVLAADGPLRHPARPDRPDGQSVGHQPVPRAHPVWPRRPGEGHDVGPADSPGEIWTGTSGRAARPTP